MHAEPEPDISRPTTTLEPPQPTLRTFDLRRSFGNIHAVNGLDLTVPEGQIYGFLGRNGAGKTTTIRMLMGIIKPDGGRIEILGKSSRRTTIKQKRRIGYVSQDQFFYPWMTCASLGKFVSGFYPSWDMDEFQRLLDLLDLPPTRRFSQLSGGMRVKLALALALSHRPALLILDEPTSGLDPVARREFLDIIQHQARNHGRTTFFSTHRIEEVEQAADRVGIIHQGRMRYEGDLSALKASVRRVTLRPPQPGRERFSIAAAEESAFESATPPPLPDAELPHSFQPENGFEVLRDEFLGGTRRLVVHGDVSAWDALSLDDVTIESLSLEDVFLAYAEAKVTRV